MTKNYPAQKRYPPELRERAVRMAQDAIAKQDGQTFGVVTRVARQLGVGTESLRNWLRQAQIDSGHQAGTSSADAQRIAELQREVRELRRANEILKAASVFFATDSTVDRRGSRLHRRPPGATTPVGCDGGSSRSAEPWRSPPLRTGRPRLDLTLPAPSPTPSWPRCSWRCSWPTNSVYGRRKLTKAARRAGLDVGRDRVARHPTALYGLLFPDHRQYRGLVDRLPAPAKERLGLVVYFVGVNGDHPVVSA